MIVAGICGASGSGKSFLAKEIIKNLPCLQVNLLSQDYYYRDQSIKPYSQRLLTNYDHPHAIDFGLMIDHISALKSNQSIRHPLYDFHQHNRKSTSVLLRPAPLLIIEGILIFAVKELLDRIDYKIYVDTPQEICFIRRLARDTIHRGRSVESVIDQYHKTVYPMFVKYVDPYKKHANLLIENSGNLTHTVKTIINHLTKLRTKEI